MARWLLQNVALPQMGCGVQAALKADSGASGVRVASVNKGVVLLSGRVVGLDEKLRAIELAAGVKGVRRVASEITTDKK